jgi:O-antigen/teichoic acid export membrane protein
MNFLSQKIKLLTSHTVVKNSLIVLIGSVSGNILAYIYHLLVGRILGPAQYGELGALISMFYILNVPSGVIQTGLTKYFAVLKARGAAGQAKTLLYHSIKILLLAGFSGLILILVFQHPVAAYLNIANSLILVMLYLVFYIYLIYVPITSLYSGYQRFTEQTLVINLSSVVRIIFGVIAAYYGVLYSVVANALSNAATIILSLWPLKNVFREKSVPLSLSKKRVYAYALPMTLAMLGVTSLYSVDVVLVKHFFSSFDAGIYTALSVLGKIIFFASFAITSVMFPTIAERKEKGQDYSGLFWNGAGIVAAISVVVTAGYFIFPELTVKLLFGKSYDSAVQYIGRFGIFLSLVTLATYFVQCFLAAGKTMIAMFVSAAAIFQILLIYQFHNTLDQVINVNITITFILCLILSAYQVISSRKL